jgi:hypothetical protein
MSEPDESIAHRFDTFTSPHLSQARPRSPGPRRDCRAAVATMRRSLRCPRHLAYGQAARRPTGWVCSWYPHRFRRHLNHTGLNRCGAEGDVMQLHPRRGWQDGGLNIGASAYVNGCPTPFDGDIAIVDSCGSPAYAPRAQPCVTE